MSKPQEFTEQALRDAIVPLGAYLDEVVVCGSWTNFIYRHWLLKVEGVAVVRTLDVDLAVRNVLPVLERPLVQQLRDAKFKVTREAPRRALWSEDADVDEEPRKTQFEPKNAPYLEFIAPATSEKPQGTIVEIQDEIGAACIDYAELLVDNTIPVEIPGVKLKVHVPTPAAYVFQKGLTYVSRRDRDKKAKDLANIFDVLNNLEALRDGLMRDLPSLLRKYSPAQWRKLHENLSRDFASPESEGVRLVQSQEPEPYRKMFMKDPTTAPYLFQETVFARFEALLTAVGKPPA